MDGFNGDCRSLGSGPVVSTLAGIVLACGLLDFAHAAPGDTELVSVAAGSAQAAGDVEAKDENLAVSADGRFVAFLAQDLVPGSTTGGSDVFVRDRSTGTTELISVGMSGPSGGSWAVSLSADARYVLFGSAAALVAGDTNRADDLYIRDRESGRTERVGPRDFEPNGNSWRGRISPDARYVAFESFATNLVPADSNGQRDVFLQDRQTGVIERMSVSSSGQQSNGDSYWASVSDDGRYVAFQSSASNLVPGDANGVADVFVRDRLTSQTQRISVGRNGTESVRDSGGTISADGRFVIFLTSAWNIVAGDTNRSPDVFLWDRQSGNIERASVGPNGVQANGPSYSPMLSADGRYLLFLSYATNLVPGDVGGQPDVFVRDRATGLIERASVSSRGVPANAWSNVGVISRDGRVAAFTSDASNLVANDFNATMDVYVHELGGTPAVPYRFTVNPDALDFGARSLFTSTTLGVWVRNKGGTPLPLESVQVRGLDRAEFRLTNRCGASVASGAGCAITVTYTPTSAGDKTARVRIVAGDNQLRIVPLQGSTSPAASVSPGRP